MVGSTTLLEKKSAMKKSAIVAAAVPVSAAKNIRLEADVINIMCLRTLFF